MVSTPLKEGDYTTVANGGIIVGRDAVLAVEGFAGVAGASWVAAAAEELTGRRPTHVVLTHYHGDHAVGQGGGSQQPRRSRSRWCRTNNDLSVLATEETNRLLVVVAEEQERLLPNQLITDPGRLFELDLGPHGAHHLT